MIKAKKYDWKDSNMALFGSDTERTVKKESAEKEPAWRRVLECNQPALFVWRIEQFKVVEWPKEQYGQFYDGDSYIILNSYLENDKLCYDVHFWIGKHSTADEYGTAAYKTVELDTLLDDLPVQHREVQGHESSLMRSYFPAITYLSGGSPSGFRQVQTREYKPRLLHFKGERRRIIVTEVGLSRSSLDNTDVFILDLGDRAYQWNSSGANKDEKFKAMQYLQQLKSSRNGRLACEAIEESDTSEEHPFYQSLKSDDADSESYAGPDDAADAAAAAKKRLLRLSDESGKLEFDEIATDSLPRSAVTEEDVFIIDNGTDVYVYVGKNASVSERKNALAYAHNYLQGSDHPFVPVTVVGNNAPAAARQGFEASF